MRTFSIMCDFGGQMAPFDIFIGQPEGSHHPLHFQADWLLKQRGGTILPEVMDAISKLNELAMENNVPLEDLCVYALGSAQEENDSAATEITDSEEKIIESSDQEELQKFEEINVDEASEDSQEYVENNEEEANAEIQNDDDDERESK